MPGIAPAIPVDDTEVAIIGGGMCGVICAGRCTELGITFRILERQTDLGGVWINLANQHSSLQCPEIMYRWDSNLPLGKGPLDRIPGSVVLKKLRLYAKELGIYRQVRFGTEVETIWENEDGYTLLLKGLEFGTTRHLRCKYLMVTHGILAQQYTLQERGLDPGSRFKGIISYAGQKDGKDCVVGTQDMSEKEVVVLGSGAFACEAMEAAIANNAKHVTMICHERKRWILPFNRELTLGAVAQAPLIPWAWKMDATHWWLKRYFYGPAGLVHMMPGGDHKPAPRDNDYAGQSNDGIFKWAKAGRVTCRVDRVAALEERCLLLAGGERLPCDVLVVAYGLKYQAEPPCLKALSIGFKDLHSFAFLGPSGRIGTAQDGIYAYVPAGPHKQIDMFLHSYACYKRGQLEAFQQKALEHTPVARTSYESLGAGGHRSAWGTFFEVSSPWAVMNSTAEVRRALAEWRARCYYRVTRFGRSPLGALRLALGIRAADLLQWVCLIGLALAEYVKERSPLELKPQKAAQKPHKAAQKKVA